MMDKENKLILYKDDEGRVSVNTRFADEDVWLTQAQLVEIYQSSKSNISEHIKHIFEDKELDEYEFCEHVDYWYCPVKSLKEHEEEVMKKIHT